jgi:hypothetical protein
MRQYQRSSENEKARMLINESYQENEEHKLELAILSEDYYNSEERYHDLIAIEEDYSPWIIDKVERVLKEMRDEDWGDFDEGYLLPDEELFGCVEDERVEPFGHEEIYDDYDELFFSECSEAFGHDDYNEEIYFPEKLDELFGDSQEDEEFCKNYFPKHLEYELNEYGYPERIQCDEDEDLSDIYYKERCNREKEESSQLMKMIRERHHLSPNKRI